MIIEPPIFLGWILLAGGAFMYLTGFIAHGKRGCIISHNYSIKTKNGLLCSKCGELKEVPTSKQEEEIGKLKERIEKLNEDWCQERDLKMSARKERDEYEKFFGEIVRNPIFRTFFNIVERDDSYYGFKPKTKKKT